MTNGEIYPLRLDIHYSRRIWGGGRLPGYLGLPETDRGAEPVGEGWLVYADNEVLNGRFAGRSLQAVADGLGVRLVGTASAARYGDKVPLLAKFIDAADRLSVQVHPDDAYALTHEAASGHLGKSEAWYVLEAARDAHVLWGFREDVDRDTVRAAVSDGTLPALMNRVPVTAGDVIYNPAGTVHAIGAGILLFEIQQSSDLTYRLYDYQRRDAAGRTRELHLEPALEVAALLGGDEARQEAVPLAGGWRRLVGCPHFVMDAVPLGDGDTHSRTDPSSLQILVLTHGRATLTWAHGEEALARGATLVLPASLGRYRLEGHGEALRCAVVPPDGEPGRVRRAGGAPPEADRGGS
ncbi:MAG TPA: type I phosphomannose isomerase catalytic subunit [Trueperaceae bacterium]|nr:type I phosphomannose isomerase catalytic subunit [Trueperaceae bacterium]